MLVVFLKKTDYNLKVTAIDTKISTLDGKIRLIDILLFSLGNVIFDGNDGYQAYLIFQPVYKHFKTITNTDYISPWKSKGLIMEI